MKIDWKYLVIFLAVFIAFIAYEVSKPKPVNWAPSFSAKDKIPLGSYVLYEMLPDLFSGEEIKKTSLSVYEVLKEHEQSSLNYIFVNNEFSPEAPDVHSLLDKVSEGSYAFIAASRFGKLLADTLHIETDDYFAMSSDTSFSQHFVNPLLDGEDHEYLSGSIYSWFSSYDSYTSTVLCEDHSGRATMLMVYYGSGAFILSTTPTAFTNYSILYKNTGAFIASALSYLPDAPVVWDEYYKEGRVLVRTPLRFILSSEALKYAYYLAISGLVLFIFFESKRRQRAIPIVEPLQNTTLEFIETLGRLYYHYKDHKNISDKIITYFLDNLRTRYYLRSDLHDKNFAGVLSEKSGVKLENTEDLIFYIHALKKKRNISEDELKILVKKINNFNRIAF